MEPEELLELRDIQGAVIPGLKKDHSGIVALRIDDVAGCKTWLTARAPEVARADEVLASNRLFKRMRARRGSEVLDPPGGAAGAGLLGQLGGAGVAQLPIGVALGPV